MGLIHGVGDVKTRDVVLIGHMNFFGRYHICISKGISLSQTNTFRIVPRNYKETDEIRKVRGRNQLGFMTKHDITLSQSGTTHHSVKKSQGRWLSHDQSIQRVRTSRPALVQQLRHDVEEAEQIYLNCPELIELFRASAARHHTRGQ